MSVITSQERSKIMSSPENIPELYLWSAALNSCSRLSCNWALSVMASFKLWYRGRFLSSQILRKTIWLMNSCTTSFRTSKEVYRPPFAYSSLLRAIRQLLIWDKNSSSTCCVWPPEAGKLASRYWSNTPEYTTALEIKLQISSSFSTYSE